MLWVDANVTVSMYGTGRLGVSQEGIIDLEWRGSFYSPVRFDPRHQTASNQWFKLYVFIYNFPSSELVTSKWLLLNFNLYLWDWFTCKPTHPPDRQTDRNHPRYKPTKLDDFPLNAFFFHFKVHPFTFTAMSCREEMHWSPLFHSERLCFHLDSASSLYFSNTHTHKSPAESISSRSFTPSISEIPWPINQIHSHLNSSALAHFCGLHFSYLPLSGFF